MNTRLTRRGRAVLAVLSLVMVGAYLGVMTLALALYLQPAFH